MSPQASGLGTDWIADLPEGWDVVKLKHIASVQNSNVDKKSEEGELPVRLCNYVDVYYNNRITPDLDFMQATATRTEIDKFRLREGDVIVTKDSESRDDIAIPAYVTRDFEDVLCGYHLALLRPHPATMDGRFLRYCFSAEKINLQFQVGANGITRYGLSLDALGGALFPVPPLEDQVGIADFLDQKTAAVDGIIRKKERLISLLQEKRQAVISRAVIKGLDPAAPMNDSEVEWLGRVPAHWGVRRLKYGVSFAGGGTPSKDNAEFWGGSVPWISPKDMKTETIIDSEDHITEEAVRSSATRIVPSGSVLVVVRSGILRHTIPVGVTQVPLTLNQDMKALIPRVYDPNFLKYLILGNQEALLLAWRKAGATVESIEHDLLANSVLPIPPMKEQREIVGFLDGRIRSVDSAIRTLQVQISKLNQYRHTLISNAVTGKIDVREAVPA